MRSPRAKTPKDYRRKQREERRRRSIAIAEMCGGLSRHTDDLEGSQRWVKTGRWEANANA